MVYVLKLLEGQDFWKGVYFIVDVEGPKLISDTCEEELVFYADRFDGSNPPTATVTWSIPQYTDNSNTPPTVTHDSGPTSGEKKGEGTYTVTYSARDAAGNPSDDDSMCTIKVVVQGISSTLLCHRIMIQTYLHVVNTFISLVSNPVEWTFIK